jgi:FtsZ-binding cell division protein ZapB
MFAIFKNFKLIVILVSITAVISITGFLYFQNAGLRKDNAVLSSNVSKLELAVNQQKDTITYAENAIQEWKQRESALKSTLTKLIRAKERAEAENRRLNNVFSAHDLKELSYAKPGLIERRINDGTAAMFGMFERETSRSEDDTR